MKVADQRRSPLDTPGKAECSVSRKSMYAGENGKLRM